MALQEKQLGQLRPANTTAASLYSPPASTTAIFKTLIIANVTAGAALYRVFHDTDGTTYDQTTALFYDVSVAANATAIIEFFGASHQDAGNIAVRTDTADALVFTLYGAEIT